MENVSPLLTAVDRLADRLRALPQSRLRAGAAAEGLALARELAVRAQRLEDPASEPRTMPEAGLFTVGDQLAVAGYDLAHALGRARSATDAPGGTESQAASAEGQVASAVALVEAAARRCRA